MATKVYLKCNSFLSNISQMQQRNLNENFQTISKTGAELQYGRGPTLKIGVHSMYERWILMLLCGNGLQQVLYFILFCMSKISIKWRNQKFSSACPYALQWHLMCLENKRLGTTTWKPPESVSNALFQFINLWRPPKSSISWEPGRSSRWYVFPSIIWQPISSSWSVVKPFIVPK